MRTLPGSPGKPFLFAIGILDLGNDIVVGGVTSRAIVLTVLRPHFQVVVLQYDKKD